MIIANPIYDVVFKRLMEDKKVAKFFIETLLEEEITNVQIKPQEFTFLKDLEQVKDKESFEKIKDKIAGLLGLSVFRLDFIATIKTPENGYKKVLIEIQKAKNPVDLMRFRNYLGEQYKKEDEVETSEGKEQIALPIITIYLLGFELPEIDTSAVKVNRQYMDLITRRVITQKNEFIEKLTHDCYVVQIPRIQKKLRSRLEELLSIFEQDYFVDGKDIIKSYNYKPQNEFIKKILSILQEVGSNPKERKEIESEREFYRIMDLNTKDKDKELKKIIKILDENVKAIEEKDKAIEEKDKVIDEKDKILDENKKAIEEKEREIIKLKDLLKKK